MIVLIGPCMFVAPLLVLLLPVAVVLWPVVLVVLGVACALLWPVATISALLGGRWLPARLATLRRWFVFMLRPWRYFDPPLRTAPQDPPPAIPAGSPSPSAGEPADAARSAKGVRH
jgi:hypothetical protein